MTTKLRAAKRRPDMRKAVFLFPSGLTLLNLFFGVFAIIAASRLEFTTAGVYVVIGGICDALDGRVARATNAGSQFGEELDSLVDAITFGLAPGMIMYFAVLNRGGWDWVWVFAFAAAAVLRLARFNIEQAGTAKTYFQGLPSPAAGITLASYYWFSQSWLYSYGAIANLKWHVALRILMAVLAALMISNVPYPTFPRTGFRSLRAIGSSIIVFGAFALLLTGKLEYFFPIAVLYVALGLVRWLLSGLFERRQPTLPYDLSEGEDDDDDETFELVESPVHTGRPAQRDDGATRPDRGRGSRLERVETASTGGRPERAPRTPERPERAERPERPAAAERVPHAERAASRDKKKDRPKRPDRTERPRGVEPPLPALSSPATDPIAPLTTDVDAITLGRPHVEAPVGDDAEDFLPDDVTELTDTGDRADADTVAEPTVAGAAGAPARKRKRRRRRGERKERGPLDAAPGLFPEASGARPPSAPEPGHAALPPSDADRSPYAASPPPPPPPAPRPPEASSPPPLPSSPFLPTPSSSTESSE